MTNPFDGSGAITTTALALAFSAYLRQHAMPQLREFMGRAFDPKRATDKPTFDKKQKNAALQLRFYDLVQIGLSVIISALTLRMAVSVFAGGQIAAHLKPLFGGTTAQGAVTFIDGLVSALALGLGILFVAVHVFVDGAEMFSKGIRPASVTAPGIEAQLTKVKSEVDKLFEAIDQERRKPDEAQAPAAPAAKP